MDPVVVLVVSVNVRTSSKVKSDQESLFMLATQYLHDVGQRTHTACKCLCSLWGVGHCYTNLLSACNAIAIRPSRRPLARARTTIVDAFGIDDTLPGRTIAMQRPR